ncbi:MAG: 3-dehydroquinate dehydratase-2 [Paracoccaceae bacterium]
MAALRRHGFWPRCGSDAAMAVRGEMFHGDGTPARASAPRSLCQPQGRLVMTKLITILNGPNLNLLGQRQPEIYGYDTLQTVEDACRAVCAPGFDVALLQSNWEGQVIDWIHEARQTSCGIVINPAAFTHTSVAILDALNTFEGPVIEVHISNVHKRESFRHHSYVSLRADGVIAGLGVEGYSLAVRRVCSLAG